MKKPKWEADGPERQEVRVLIENHEASVIIGKGGANVKKLRVDSGAFVSVLKSEGNAKERVLQVRGSVGSNTSALKMIAELLIENDNQRNSESEPKDSWALKILIHKFLAGAIIGKGGAIIKAMQTETGAKVSVSTEPLGNSTEKTVTVTGTTAVLYDVITRVLTQVCENPIKPGTSSEQYVPGKSMGFALPPGYGAPYGMPAPGPYGMPPQGQYGAPPQGPYGGPPMGHGGMGGPPGMGGPGPSMSAGAKTQKIVIPTVCAGTVIGKGGTIIRDIKNQSGTTISVAAPESTSSEDRVVSITGSEQGIQAAISMIRQRVESYQAAPGPGY